MSREIDARGLACPAPVMKTRDALKGGAGEIQVLVDNPTARDNVSRFASSQGLKVKVAEEGDCFRITITGAQEAAETRVGADAVREEAERRTVVVLSQDIMGRGDEELGTILIKAFMNTLAESDTLPWRILLFNRGVILAAREAETVEALRNLEESGVEILVCGTCLDYFGLKEKLAVGTVSNMYDILTTMLTSTNSVTI